MDRVLINMLLYRRVRLCLIKRIFTVKVIVINMKKVVIISKLKIVSFLLKGEREGMIPTGPNFIEYKLVCIVCILK